MQTIRDLTTLNDYMENQKLLAKLPDSPSLHLSMEQRSQKRNDRTKEISRFQDLYGQYQR